MLLVVIVLFASLAGHQTALAVSVPFNITGTIDASDPVFDPDKTLLDCSGTWTGTNWHYETRTLTVDQTATLTLRDVNNSMPGSPNANDAAYGVYDVTSTPFNASNLPLTSQCLGGATNNLNVTLSPGNTYLLVVENFYNASGGSYNLQVTSTNGAVNVVVGTPGGAPPSTPTITGITSAAANGNYGSGVTFDIQVNFSEPVQYSSIGVYMTLALNNGGSAVCTYCNQYPTPASSTYNFTYTTGGTVTDLDIASTSALALNGGTLQSTGGTTANITLPSPGAAGSLGANKNIAIVNPTLSVNNVSVTEGNSGTTNAGFTATLSHSLVAPTVTVNYATANVTATSGSDYTAASGALTFSPGTTVQPINVSVNGDALNEPNETFRVNLSGASGASVSGFGTGTIINDDPPPTVSINNVTVTEGNAGTVIAGFTVSLSAASGQTVTVNYATANASATAGSDYVAVSGTLTFAPGATTQPVNVTVNGDTAFETDETFTVGLNSPSNASIATGTGTGTITNDDSAPTVSIGNGAVAEGNAGTTTAALTVSLSAASYQTITLDYASADGTATAGSDYVAVSGTLTFAPGVTTQPLNVTVNGDTIFETNETFTVTLSNPSNTSIVTGTGTGTITNDDTQPNITINDVSVTEGNAGTVTAVFTVSLSAASVNTITVDYATADNTAAAGSDYVATSGTLTFAPGVMTQPVNVMVNGDTTYEVNETFFVNLSNPSNAAITDNQGQGTITNDDAQPSISINDITVTEGDAGTVTASFTVSLSNTSSQSITVDYATANNSAAAGSDYVAASGTLTFAPGVTTQLASVTVNGDTLDEVDETYFVNLSNAVNASSISDNQGLGTITDDDSPPSMSMNDVTVTEGNAGTVTASFTASLSVASGQIITVDYGTADNSAAAGSDYVAASGTLTFTAGVTTQPVNVTVNGDTTFEVDETYFVNLTGPVNVTISDNQGQGTITNDDTQPSISINDVTVTEGNAGTVNAGFTVTLSNASSQTVTVDYATANNTASAGNDYVAASGTVTFTAGVTTQAVNIIVNGDNLFEGDETYFVNLSNAVNASSISDNQGQGTITNDDVQPAFGINDITVAEGNSGTTSFSFTVTRTNNTNNTDTVDYSTTDGTAAAGSDYTAASGTLTFTAGQVTQTMTVLVNGDISLEADETFVVNLSNASAPATISDNQGQGTITNDDVAAGLSINDVTLAEGNSGTTTFSFTVSRNGDTTVTTTVDYATADGTAVAGSDYTAASGTLTFTPGQTTQTINVAVGGDISLEGNESFVVNLSNASAPATINDNQGLGTINNDDVAAGLSINDVTLTEGNSGSANMTFTVTRNGDTTVTTTVDFSTADGSATTADNDYAAASGTLIFNPGDTSQSISVTVNGDVLFESDETFVVNLSNASAPATISDNQGLGTIQNDEAAPGLSVADVTVGESDVVGQFTISLNPANSVGVTVDYSIADGTGVNGVHYVAATSGTLTFNPGDTSQTVSFAIPDNDIVNGNRTFSLSLSNTSGPTIVRATGNATIIDNELTIISLPAPPPAPACTDVNFDPNSEVRTHFTNDIDRPALNCRMIAANGNYLYWNGGPLTTSANIGNRTVLDLGVIAAVDVFSPGGATGFVGDVNVCLKGSGYMIYLNANGQPRVPQLWSSWTTDAFPGYTCTTLYAPGTVVLVQGHP
ncbi:MAG: Calx-beta domain-containing protein [Anaerolineae bacterium]